MSLAGSVANVAGRLVVPFMPHSCSALLLMNFTYYLFSLLELEELRPLSIIETLYFRLLIFLGRCFVPFELFLFHSVLFILQYLYVKYRAPPFFSFLMADLQIQFQNK